MGMQGLCIMLHSYPLADFLRVRDTVLVNSRVESKFSLPWSSLSGQLLWHSVSVASIVSCGQRIILVGDLMIGACIDGCDLIPTVQMASQQLSRLLEISGRGYPFYIFIMVPVGLWVSTCSCPVHLLFCLFTAQPIQPGPSSLSLQPSSHPYPLIQISLQQILARWISNVSLTLGI